MQVHVVDYGIGNIFNLLRALSHLQVETLVCQRPSQLKHAERIIVPGVGAFKDCMNALTKFGFVPWILEHVQKRKPLLGICVGMQMLANHSEEFGDHEGLGIIAGKVVSIQRKITDQKIKIPHIAWEKVHPPTLPGKTPSSWQDSIFFKIPNGFYAYFLHSFTFETEDPEHTLACCHYKDNVLTAAVKSGSIYGTQFHPERSGKVGLKILQEFSNLS